MARSEPQRVELGSVAISPNGGGFVLDLLDANQGVQRMELPPGSVQQLMRILPRLDAALMQARDELSSDLIAHTVVQWSVQPTGVDGSIAMSLQNSQRVELAYLLAADDARALHAALGEALASSGLAPMAPTRVPLDLPQRAINPVRSARSAAQALAAVDSTRR
ncbi:MAG TPA: hypothetical protein VGM74_18955 [Burkholderiaceae bacterium]|jgi:hypothetical protein